MTLIDPCSLQRQFRLFHKLSDRPEVYPLLLICGIPFLMFPVFWGYIAASRTDVQYKPWSIKDPWESMDLAQPSTPLFYRTKPWHTKPRTELKAIYDEMKKKEISMCKQFGPIPRRSCPF